MSYLPSLTEALNFKAAKKDTLSSLTKSNRSIIKLSMEMPTLSSDFRLDPIDNSLNIYLNDTLFHINQKSQLFS